MASSDMTVSNKFSVRLAAKVHRLKKMLKPMVRFLNSKKASSKSCDCHTPSSPPSKLWVDDADVATEDNDANEALEARLREDMTSRNGGGNISVWIQGQLTLVPILPGQYMQCVPVPVHFLSTASGDFLWTPLPDSDICAGQSVHTSGQTAQVQTPSSGQRCSS